MANIEFAAFDLIHKMSPFWDAAMLLPVLQWLEEQQMYPMEDITTVRNNVLNATSATEEKKAVNSRTAADLEYYLKSYIAALVAYKKDQQHRMNGTPEKKSLNELSEWCQKQKNIKDVKEEDLPFPSDVVEKLLLLSKVFYQLGDYAQSKSYAEFYLNHVCELLYEGGDVSRRMSCHWAVATNTILSHSLRLSYTNNEEKGSLEGEVPIDGELDTSTEPLKPEEAAYSILKLEEMFESNSNKFSKETMILQRSWLLHWALWPIFRHYLPSIFNQSFTPPAACWNQIIDWAVDDRTLAIVQLTCPHMMRYYSAYAILNRKRKDHFQAIVKMISATKHKYSDAFTSLLEALFIDFNFDVAQQHLLQITTTCSADFFLDPLKASIEEHSRLLIFEIYCRIHQSINLNMIAKKMNMTADVAERWIVNLIRNAKLEAKIDSEKNRVDMTMPPPSIYQQILDKTRNAYSRSATIYQNLLHSASGKGDGDSKDLIITSGQQQRGARNQRNAGQRYAYRNDESNANRKPNNRSGMKTGNSNSYNMSSGATLNGKGYAGGSALRGDDGFWE